MSALKLTVNNWGEVALDKAGLKKLMRGAGNDIRSKTARLMTRGSGGGRSYAGGGGAAYRGAYRRGGYRASAPGDPPVRVSGTLYQSMRTYVYPSGEGFAVRARAFYGLFLETGARGGGNPGGRAVHRTGRRRQRGAYTVRVLQPRPYLDRIMRQEEPNLERRVRAALDEGLTWRETK